MHHHQSELPEFFLDLSFSHEKNAAAQSFDCFGKSNVHLSRAILNSAWAVFDLPI
jgi:hypothetical protein